MVGTEVNRVGASVDRTGGERPLVVEDHVVLAAVAQAADVGAVADIDLGLEERLGVDRRRRRCQVAANGNQADVEAVGVRFLFAVADRRNRDRIADDQFGAARDAAVDLARRLRVALSRVDADQTAGGANGLRLRRVARRRHRHRGRYVQGLGIDNRGRTARSRFEVGGRRRAGERHANRRDARRDAKRRSICGWSRCGGERHRV